jgi:hypothetical protein
MKKSWLQKIVICISLLWLAGCAANKYVKTTDQVCVPAATEAAAMAAAEKVLADMHFAIEKFDAETGLIRTYPLAGAQTFEFWRTDNVGSFNRAEADLHSIRRTVELNISRQSGQLCINCEATTQRLSLPQGQTVGDRSQMAMTPGHESPQNLKLKANVTWIDLGRDNQLETEIIKRIEKRLTTGKPVLPALRSSASKAGSAAEGKEQTK